MYGVPLPSPVKPPRIGRKRAKKRVFRSYGPSNVEGREGGLRVRNRGLGPGFRTEWFETVSQSLRVGY